MLSLKKRVAEFLKFDEHTHSVQILPNPPGQEDWEVFQSILSYSDGNKLDVTKLFNSFLTSVYHVVESLSRDTEFLSDHNLEKLSVGYTPCISKIVFESIFNIIKYVYHLFSICLISKFVYYLFRLYENQIYICRACKMFS